MFVVLLHMLYLLGKHVYESYQVKELRRASIDVYDDESDDSDVPCIKIYSRKFDHVKPAVKLTKPWKFSPPVYFQRYKKVAEILADTKYQGKLRKVADFGCSELNFLTYIKKIAGVEEILCIDIDRQVLEDNEYKARPLVADYIHERSTPLKIELYEGSVTHHDKKLEETDAVICIELIEHLDEHELNCVSQNIFGYIMPKVVIITTPNADFNVLFPNFTGSRHPDHKFEWTREEFQDWAQDILKLYPYYSVTFQGIANGPDGTEEFGACTQMAIFNRRDDYIELLREKGELNQLIGVEGLFELVDAYDYPYCKDNRSDEEKILDEAAYYINFISQKDSDTLEVVELSNILFLMRKFSPSIEALRVILVEGGWTVVDRENGPAVLVPEPSIPSNCSVDADQLDIDNDDDGVTNTENIYNYSCPSVYGGVNEDDYNEDWCEEPSILIPQNHSVIHENTYLFDGEDFLSEQYHLSEEPAATCNNNTRHSRIDNNEESIVSTEQELQNNSNSLASSETEMNGVAQAVDSNTSSVLTKSVALPRNNLGLSNTMKNLSADLSADIKTQPALSQAVEINSRSIQGICDSELRFQPHLSVSRSSTSPEPLLFDVELNNSHNYSTSYQNESYNNQYLLDSTFQESELAGKAVMDAQDPTVEDIVEVEKLPLGCYKHREINFAERMSSNYPEIDSSHNIEQDNISSMKNQICGNDDITDIDLLNIHSSTSNNQPKLTSSPRLYRKVPTTNILKQDLTQDTNKELLEKENLINHEIDVVNVQKVDTNHSLSLDQTIKYKEENAYYTSETVTIKTDVQMEAHLENVIDLEQPNINEKSLSPPRELLSCKSQDDTKYSPECAKEINIFEDSFQSCGSNEDTNNTIVQSTLVSKSDENVGCDIKDPASKGLNISNTARVIDNIEAKPSSPTYETPPDSWSHEIMDSGYPNSTSAQDITPENDLSSIAQDHIPDIESPSVAEAPRPGVLEPIEVENGDLANNNRDDEGNNMMAVDANDIGGLQPLIDVLENDLENENDIYVLENGFPIWLLRILDMANPLDFDVQPQQNLRVPDENADDANYLGHDEGFDSSSSENDSDIANN